MPHVVIVGAGYAGLAAYLALRPAAQHGHLDLTIVNGDDRHLLLPELPLYLAGEQRAGRVRLDLRRLVRPPARLLLGRVTALEPDGPAICGDDPIGRLEADGLVVALGSVSDDFGVPGVTEHATAIGRWDDMRALRANLLEDLARRSRSAIVVVGGGFTGVEIATELAERGRDTGAGLTVTLIAPHILPTLPRRAQTTGIEALRQLGIVWQRAHAQKVEADAVTLDDGGRVQADTVIWAAGVRANPVLATSGLPLDRRGRAVVDEHLRAAPRVFVAGDCAAALDPRTGKAMAPTAQAALQAGPLAGRNLMAALRGDPLEVFHPRDRGMLVSLGQGLATGRLAGRAVAGEEVALLKRIIERYHAFQVGGLEALGLRLRRAAARAEQAQPVGR